jgi:hypothetical protein
MTNSDNVAENSLFAGRFLRTFPREVRDMVYEQLLLPYCDSDTALAIRNSQPQNPEKRITLGAFPRIADTTCLYT